MSTRVNPGSSSSNSSQISLSDSRYVISFERNNHGEIFIDDMLAEMIENVYAGDVSTDEEMEAEIEQEIHVIQSDTEEITVKGKGGVSNRGRKGKYKSRGEENEGIHESSSKRVRHGNRGRGRGRGKGQERGNAGIVLQQTASLPPPTFEPMQKCQPAHRGYATLPHEMLLGTVTPLAIFQLFFTDNQLQTIVENTNKYEQMKGFSDSDRRPWSPLTLKELKIWIALVIYMGVHKIYAVEDLWNNNERKPIHNIKDFMTLVRFQQIKHFFHISSPSETQSFWYSKVEPLASHLRNMFKKLYMPGTNVSVDEMIARFSGRSIHTVRMKNKPTPEGYKIVSLCDAGYTWTFTFTSRIEKNREIEQIAGLTETGCLVWHLVRQLPDTKSYDVYMDNYFSSIALFKYMRDNGYGACGTVRLNSAKFPAELKHGKYQRLDWNTLLGKVVENVLAILWIDNGPVTMLTTIHNVCGDDWNVARERRRPRETSTNANTVRRVFGNLSKKSLQIPKIIDDYNHYMGGVDIADQLRG
ncbi:4867_t:CDS:1, partial [Paraglomus occultum]